MPPSPRTVGLDVEPIRRRRLYEDIVKRIEKLIVTGEFTPGDQLPSERELMVAFAVGRPAVREALFALSKMGLIALQNGERAVVTQPTPKLLIGELSGAARHLLAEPEGVRHFQHARALFEVALARDAARRATDADIARLRDALAANKRCLDDRAAFVESDVAFHLILAQIPGNPIFTALHAAIAEWLKEQRTTSVREGGSSAAACRAHERIFKAIAARDPDKAEKAMGVHLAEVEKFYWQARGDA